MPTLLDFSRFQTTQRRPNTGANSIPGGVEFLFALGAETGPGFGFADATFTENGTPYVERIGWRAGDFARVSQPVAVLPENGLQFEAVLQAPDGAPAGHAWVFQVLRSDGITETEIFRRAVTTRRKRFSVRLPTAEIVGGTLVFQIQLVAV